MADKTREQYLQQPVVHYDMKRWDPRPHVTQMERMAFQARNLHRAAHLYDRMIADPECAIILCLAGSLISAGLKQVIVDMVRHRMVDAIVSTGANIVDQDFFEGLGFSHYIGTPHVDDNVMRELRIDRIYDTYIDEDDLRVCDETIARIADGLEPRAYSSREFIAEMGRHLSLHGKTPDSIVLEAWKNDVPVFCPAFSDCSAGFGLVLHQWKNRGRHLTIDSVADFLELTRVKIERPTTGLLMIGGGVPKNFAQDIVVAAEVLGIEAPMHQYAIQLTVADERDGALSGSTLREACSWGKVSTAFEQMVYGEATVTMPLVCGYAYHQGNWRTRSERRLARIYTEQPATA